MNIFQVWLLCKFLNLYQCNMFYNKYILDHDSSESSWWN